MFKLRTVVSLNSMGEFFFATCYCVLYPVFNIIFRTIRTEHGSAAQKRIWNSTGFEIDTFLEEGITRPSVQFNPFAIMSGLLSQLVPITLRSSIEQQPKTVEEMIDTILTDTDMIAPPFAVTGDEKCIFRAIK